MIWLYLIWTLYGAMAASILAPIIVETRNRIRKDHRCREN